MQDSIDVSPATINIVGGNGEFGKLIVRMFQTLGNKVLVSDLNTELTPEKAAEISDVTVISVPIGDSVQVIEKVGPHIREDALLMDVTSIKSIPVKAMLASTKASVIGTHPMFGPATNSLAGQRVIVCKGRGEKWSEWIIQSFRKVGLSITESTPEYHDQAMSVVQVLTHFQTQVLGLTLARLGIPIEETRPFMSPAYLLELYVTARHFAQSPNLYGPLEMMNPATPGIMDVFRNVSAEISQIIEGKDQDAFNEMFREVGEYFGDFTHIALEESRHLIDNLSSVNPKDS